MLVSLGNSLNELLSILVIAGPNVTLFNLGQPWQAPSGICPAALNVILVTSLTPQDNTPGFKQRGLFITIVLTLLFPANGT